LPFVITGRNKKKVAAHGLKEQPERARHQDFAQIAEESEKRMVGNPLC
jgi:hypothetical protein